MIVKILEAIIALLQAIPIFDRWFRKSSQQKIEDANRSLDDEQKEVAETGRPPA